MSGTVRLEAPEGPTAPPYEMEIEALVQTLDHLSRLLAIYEQWYGRGAAKHLFDRAVQRSVERAVGNPGLALQFLGEKRSSGNENVRAESR